MKMRRMRGVALATLLIGALPAPVRAQGAGPHIGTSVHGQASAPNAAAPAQAPDGAPVRTPPSEPAAAAAARAQDRAPDVGVELVAGLLLLESSRGAGVEPQLGLGVRGVWELGRRFEAQALRDGLFLDLGYQFTSARAGTELVFTDTQHHSLAAAPAFGWAVLGRDVVAYVQVGGGVSFQRSTLHYDGGEAVNAGFQPLLQYGLGVRGRPALTANGRLRIAFRIELTRFRRHYMDDTFLGASLGAVF